MASDDQVSGKHLYIEDDGLGPERLTMTASPASAPAVELGEITCTAAVTGVMIVE
jgi:hypothetical protein